MLKNIIPLIFLSIFITSCTVTREFVRPDLLDIEQYRGAKDQDSTSLGHYEWRDFFQDELLARHIEEGLANNLDVLRAQENLKISAALVKQSKAAFLPKVSTGFDAALTKPSSESFQGASLPRDIEISDFSLSAQFSWEWDVWGKLRSRKKAAVARFLQTENVQNLIKSEVVYGIAVHYYLLQSLDAKRQIILNNITNREEGVETTQSLKESGSVTEVAVKQNEALLYTAQALLVDVENQITIRENILSVLLGKAPQTIQRSPLADQQILDALHVGVPIELLSNRPDVMAAEYNLLNAFEMTNAARASFYPTLTISGSGGLNSDNFGDLFNANAIFSHIAGGLLQPVFAQRQLKTQREVRLSEQEIALLDYRKAILTAYQEVSNALSTFDANSQKLVIKKRELVAFEKALEDSEMLQAQGFTNYLEILRARDNALGTALNIVDIELERLMTQASLYRALGGGWR